MYCFKKKFTLKKNHLKYAVFKETILIKMHYGLQKVDTLFDVIVNCDDQLNI